MNGADRVLFAPVFNGTDLPTALWVATARTVGAIVADRARRGPGAFAATQTRNVVSQLAVPLICHRTYRATGTIALVSVALIGVAPVADALMSVAVIIVEKIASSLDGAV